MVESMVPAALVICSPTFFKSKEEPRFVASMDTLSVCRERGFRVLLVDGSPVDTGVPAALEECGAVVEREEGRGKSNALRQALRAAGERFSDAQVFAFQELEKTDFIRHYNECVLGMLGNTEWELCNPARSESSWKTYPVEQEHEEKFQNRLMDLNANRHGFNTPLDWSFGPFLLKRTHLHRWLEYPGQGYDSQWGPMIKAIQDKPDIVIGTPVLDYKHSESMKREEEGSWKHAKIRLKQLNETVAAHEEVWGEPKERCIK